LAHRLRGIADRFGRGVVETRAQARLEARLECGDPRMVRPALGAVELVKGREMQGVHVEERCHRNSVVEGVRVVTQGAFETVGETRVVHGTLIPTAPEAAILGRGLAERFATARGGYQRSRCPSATTRESGWLTRWRVRAGRWPWPNP